MSIIIRRSIDLMTFVAYMALSFNTFFIFFWFNFLSLNIWLHVLYASVYFVNVVFLLLCLRTLTVMYVPLWVFCFIVLLCVLCLCMKICNIPLLPRVNPLAVKCIISYNMKMVRLSDLRTGRT